MNAAANTKFEQRVYEDALKLYSKAIQQAPQTPKFYTNRAAVHVTVGRYEEAISDCVRALALDPYLIKGHKRVAKARCEEGRGRGSEGSSAWR